ncbi:sensor histidine kinase [Actinomadura litoris]|uniref:sensor histidine kinase n=1 Tax=Actinomadura litoris TaxID=2678616 RepID=UPI001FA7D51C|nr:ATP-binding protein [Actinomadura litoris]
MVTWRVGPGAGERPRARPGPSDYALTRTVLRFTISLRCGGVLAAIIAAVIGEGAGVSRVWQAWVLGGLAAWAVFFAARAVGRGLTFGLVAADTFAVSLVLLVQDRLVAVDAVVDETTWAIMLASTSIYVAQLALSQPAGLAMAMAVTAAYMTGVPAETSQVRILFVQTVVVNALMWLLRRGGGRADAIVAERDRERRQAMVEAARRADERHHRSEMHDSVLATLVMVASGAVQGGSPVLSRNAQAALDVLEEFSVSPLTGEPPPVDLGERLEGLAVEMASLVAADITTGGVPLMVPEPVAVALTGAAREALRNVACHSGVARAEVRAEVRAGGVMTVTVADRGRGFDPSLVPGGRHGIRGSIRERMLMVGGTGLVDSRPGEGTVVTLRWPHG